MSAASGGGAGAQGAFDPNATGMTGQEGMSVAMPSSGSQADVDAAATANMQQLGPIDRLSLMLQHAANAGPGAGSQPSGKTEPVANAARTPEGSGTKGGDELPVSIPPEITGLMQLIAGMGGSTAMPAYQGGMAEGGNLRPGESATVGEAGPEMVVAQPSGGTAVVPYYAAAPESEGILARRPDLPAGMPARSTATAVPPITERPPSPIGQPGLVNHLLSGLVGLAGPGAIQAGAQANSAWFQRARELSQLGVSHPELLSNPNIAVHVDRFYGPGTARSIMAANSPEGHNAITARMLGLTLPTDENGGVAGDTLINAIHAFRPGMGIKVGPKGTEAYERAPSATERGAQEADRFVANRTQMYVARGQDETSAQLNSFKDLIADAGMRGYVVPPSYRRLAYASAENEVAASKAGMEEDRRQQVALRYAGDLARLRRGGGVVGEAEGRAATYADPSLRLGLEKPENIKGYNSMVDVMSSLMTPDVANLFPSEQEYSRSGARVKGQLLDSWLRQYTDPANADAAIRRLAEMRIQAERLAIGGVPRAQGIVELLGSVTKGIENRSYSREQFVASLRQLHTMIGDLGVAEPLTPKEMPGAEAFDKMLGGGRRSAAPTTPAAAAPAQAPPPARSGQLRGLKAAQATGATIRGLATHLAEMTKLSKEEGGLTDQEALKLIEKARRAGLPEE